MTTIKEAAGQVSTWLGIISTIVIAAISYGIIYNKVNTLDATVREQSALLQQTREQLVRVEATNAQLVQTLQDIKSDVNAIREQQRKLN